MKKPKKKAHTLTFQELLDFVKGQDQILQRRSPKATDTIRLLSRTVKLGEETGELASAVLASIGDQRSVKLARYNDDQLGEEIADVIITVLVLAETLRIDVPDALRKKIEKIKQRSKN